jgi:hypothetical protein
VARASRRQVAGKTGRANGQPSELSGRKRAGGSSGISTNQMIGIGVGVLAVLLIGFLAFSNRGGDKQENRARKTVEAVKDEGESTPCPQLVKLAEQSLANGDKSRAVNYYSRAANRAEQDGNTNQALQYSMKAKQLMFTSKLKDR